MPKTIIKFGWADAYAIDNDKVHLFLRAFENAIKVNDTYVKSKEGVVWYECNKQTLPGLEMLPLSSTVYSEAQVEDMKKDTE